MLETIGLDQKLSKKEHKARISSLRDRLYDVQEACSHAEIPVPIIFEGWGAAGKGDIIQAVTRRLDPRGFRIHPIQAPRTYETHMPWLRLPEYGEMVICDQSWYHRVLTERVEGVISESDRHNAYADMVDLERALTDDGCVIINFWLHISGKRQKKRLKKFKSDPLTGWRVQPEDWDHYRSYDECLNAVEAMLEHTDTEWGPWTIVEATDRRWARVKVFEMVIPRLHQVLMSRQRTLPPSEIGPDPAMLSDISPGVKTAAPWSTWISARS